MKGKRIDEEKVRRILELHAQGRTLREIRDEVGVGAETARRYIRGIRQTKNRPLPEFTKQPGPPPELEHDTLIDNTDVDGTVSLVRRSKGDDVDAYSADQLKELAGLNREWLATHHAINSWPTAMKIKRPGGEEIVHQERLWQSKTSFRRIIVDELREAIADWLTENMGAAKPPRRIARPVPIDKRPYLVTCSPYDAHFGMYAYAKEVGADYDVNIAFDRTVNAIDDIVAELSLYNVKKLVAPIGNDFMHFDNVRQTTAQSEHALDCDSRWTRTYRAALKALTYMVDRFLSVTDDLELVWIPGNHDTMTSYTIVHFLRAWFRHDSRVTLDASDNPRKIRRWGGTALLLHHGHKVKPAQWPVIFHEEVLAHAREHDLSTHLTYKEVQLGHTHQRRTRNYEGELPTNGVHVVTMPALCNADFWHHSQGLIGEPMKAIEARRFDEVGFRGSHVSWARDDARKIS